MICPQCTFENRDAAENCASCGHALTLPEGTVLAGRYVIKSLLGVGGLGRVYRAHDRMLDELVAVKLLNPEAARSPELSKRFRSEIKLARKVRHRNVCAIHEYGEHEGYRFVAMELVDGVDLHRILRERGPLPTPDAFDVAIQVSKGLSAIHAAGVLHRDLKTPNIMRDSKGDVRLLDFGIAKLITPTGTAITAVQKVVGTPEYMSPEQIRGDELDERSDIYGLGIVIYEIFSGSVPFRGRSPLDTLVKHMNTPPPLYGEAAARFPASLVPVLRTCLAKLPEQRYRSARELIDALRFARDVVYPGALVTPPERSRVTPMSGLETKASGASAEAPSRASAPVSASRPLTPRPMAVLRPAAVAPPLSPPRTTPSSGRPTLPPPRNATPSQEERPVPRVLPADPVPTVATVDSREPDASLPLRSDEAPPSNDASVPLPVSPAPSVGWRGSGLGAAMALLGLSATVGAWFWQRQALSPRTPPHTAAAPAMPPTQVAGTSGAVAPSATPPTRAESKAPSEPEGDVAATSPGKALTPEPTPAAAVKPTPPPAMASSASWDIEMTPAGEVEVDGRLVGLAPLRGLQLPRGTRVLKLSHPEYWPLTRRVVVEAGKADRLNLYLAWESVARTQSRTAPFANPLDDSPTDPDFMSGLQQMSEGSFREALLTLEPVARRLELAGNGKELARAHFYLAVALLELNRRDEAKERFQRALDRDPSFKVPPTAFSPKIVSFFSSARAAAAQTRP
jgi:serine/threonine protein kinase